MRGWRETLARLDPARRRPRPRPPALPPALLERPAPLSVSQWLAAVRQAEQPLIARAGYALRPPHRR